MRIAVFASGNGSNFQALVEYFRKKHMADPFVWLFCDQPDGYVLERATTLGIPKSTFSPKEFQTKKAYEEKILEILLAKKVDLIVLAGYMRIIGSTLLDEYESRIINIHPSLLPSFPGLHGIRDAFEASVETTGVTIHYIDKGVDTGPIIFQESVKIEKNDTLEVLEERIHRVEHRIYPRVIEQVVKEKITMEACIK